MNKYKKRYYEKNKEKWKAYRRKYYQEHREEEIAKQKIRNIRAYINRKIKNEQH